jgi:aspartyl-tRNA(Asn)/glutamyl-tRNA(Gln) amidotransferase subunit C
MAETVLSAEDVRAIADLARLELSEDDVVLYQRQLSEILDYFAKLQELDTSHIDPTSSVLPLTNVMREDRAGAPLSVDDVVANAPDSDGQQFRVRAVLEGGE